MEDKTIELHATAKGLRLKAKCALFWSFAFAALAFVLMAPWIRGVDSFIDIFGGIVIPSTAILVGLLFFFTFRARAKVDRNEMDRRCGFVSADETGITIHHPHSSASKHISRGTIRDISVSTHSHIDGMQSIEIRHAPTHNAEGEEVWATESVGLRDIDPDDAREFAKRVKALYEIEEYVEPPPSWFNFGCGIVVGLPFLFLLVFGLITGHAFFPGRWSAGRDADIADSPFQFWLVIAFQVLMCFVFFGASVYEYLRIRAKRKQRQIPNPENAASS